MGTCKGACQYADDIGMQEHRCSDKCYYEFPLHQRILYRIKIWLDNNGMNNPW